MHKSLNLTFMIIIIHIYIQLFILIYHYLILSKIYIIFNT